jgi:hypothetical protein
MRNDRTLLESNHSRSRPDEPSTQLPLLSLQEILRNRITEKKGEIHESNNIAYTNILSAEIETLHCVLAQILTLKRRITIQQETDKED